MQANVDTYTANSNILKFGLQGKLLGPLFGSHVLVNGLWSSSPGFMWSLLPGISVLASVGIDLVLETMGIYGDLESVVDIIDYMSVVLNQDLGFTGF